MFFILRTIRAIFGIISVLNLLQILTGTIFLINNMSEIDDIGKYFALLLLKIIIFSASGFAFLWMRIFINKIHEKKHGKKHPAFDEKPWNI
jgi:uncharacterized membrane protein